jgi:hypothetical protein
LITQLLLILATDDADADADADADKKEMRWISSIPKNFTNLFEFLFLCNNYL